MKHDNGFKYFSLGTIWLWLTVFALLPLCLVILASFFSHNQEQLVTAPFTFENYLNLFNPFHLTVKIFERSFYIAGLSTIICLVLGYPFAFFIARMRNGWKGFLILLVIIPFWTSSLIRTYSMITILKPKGMLFGLTHHTIHILYTDMAVLIGLVYNLLPFMILPLLTNIERLDQQLIDAAKDLGANRFTTFTRIILPLTMPGILAGCILVFLPAMTIFYIPDLLGGAKSILLGNLIQSQFLVSQNWPGGSAVSIALTLLLGVLLMIYWRSKRDDEATELL